MASASHTIMTEFATSSFACFVSTKPVPEEGITKVFERGKDPRVLLWSAGEMRVASVAGRLSPPGAPTEFVQGSHEDVVAVVLTCVQAMRRGHYALWKDPVTSTRLAQLDPSFHAKPNRRRRKPGPDAGAAGYVRWGVD